MKLNIQKIIVVVAVFMATLAPAWAKNVKGKVTAKNLPLAEVVVTDGTHFTKTDNKGTFSFEVNDTADFVYIFTPSGYSAPFETGTPVFYKCLAAETGDLTFTLQVLPYSTEDYALLAIADPQTRHMKHFERFERESVTDLKSTIDAYKAKNVNAVGIALGDIAWDKLDIFNNYKQAMASLNIPFYPVIGNHDHDLNADDDYASAEIYRKQFGPTDYGFVLGKQFYIVLDDILYHGHKSYDDGLTAAQLDWVKHYLQYVPKGSELVFALHAPFSHREKRELIKNGQELLDICKNYTVSFISGHTHLNTNLEVAPGIWEHNIGAICGTWWTADECRDGVPNGYQVFEGSNESYSWYYKSVGRDTAYQLEVYDRGEVAQHANAVVAKIWNWDQQWKIHWFADGKPMGEMTQVNAYDPNYLHYLHKKDPNGEKTVPGYKQPVESFFYFAAQPSSDTKYVMVVATDRFGRQYKKEIELKSVDVEAHRGAAGVFPENTIEAMLNAVKMGVNTLELDVQITKDGQVIVAHDAHINSAFTLDAQGKEISEKQAKKLVFHKMNYDEIKTYDTGSKTYDRFPNQQKVATHIPLFSALIDSVENFTTQNGYSPIHYNIEIKSSKAKENKGLVLPFEAFSDKAMAVIKEKNLGDRLLVQSFDERCLNYIHENHPEINLAFLVSNKDGFDKNMAKLNFVPAAYSPNYKLVDETLVTSCKAKGLKLVPWTVDESEDIKQMIKLNVDGIISNYPDRVLKETRGY